MKLGLEAVYDWIGVGNAILNHTKNQQDITILDANCGTGRRLKYLKEILQQRGKTVTAIGILPKSATYKDIAEKNLDKIASSSCRQQADCVIMLDITIPILDIIKNPKWLLKRGGLLIYTQYDSTYNPITLGKTGKLTKIARKLHRIGREIDGISLDAGDNILSYERIGILDELEKYAKSHGKKELIIVDAGCGSGKSAQDLKAGLARSGIQTLVIGIDDSNVKPEGLDGFIRSRVENLSNVMPIADIVLSIGSGPFCLPGRLDFIHICSRMLRNDGVYIENIMLMTGQYKLVKKQNINNYLSMLKLAGDKIIWLPYGLDNIQSFAFMDKIKPTSNHTYGKKLEKFNITPHELAFCFIKYKDPKDWNPRNYGNLSIKNLFKPYILQNNVLFYDDLFEII